MVSPEEPEASPPSAPDASVDAPTLQIPVRVELPPEEVAPLAGPRGEAPARRRTTGRYRVDEEIGRGGMGIVYRAFDRDLRRQVATKVMLHGLGVKRELAERFVEEAQATAQL